MLPLSAIVMGFSPVAGEEIVMRGDLPSGWISLRSRGESMFARLKVLRS